jgi:hypothetical protein
MRLSLHAQSCDESKYDGRDDRLGGEHGGLGIDSRLEPILRCHNSGSEAEFYMHLFNQSLSRRSQMLVQHGELILDILELRAENDPLGLARGGKRKQASRLRGEPCDSEIFEEEYI